jgi:hypothetical protein
MMNSVIVTTYPDCERSMKFYRLLLILLLLPLFTVTPSHAQQETSIWRSGETVYNHLFNAQRLLFTINRASDPDAIYQEAQALLNQSLATYQTELEPTAQLIAPSPNQAIITAFDDAQTALDQRDHVAFASARGQIWANLLWLSHDVTQHAILNNDLTLAGAWLPLREYRQATSVTLVDNPSSRSLRNVEQDKMTTDEALIIVTNDLRDAYFFRLRDALNELENAIQQNYSVRAGEWAGQVAGYFNILQADYAEKQGEAQDRAESLAALVAQAADELEITLELE